MQKIKVVTIWSAYGPYHVARVNALQKLGYEVVCFSYCSSQKDYPFFSLVPTQYELINDCEFSAVDPWKSFWRTLKLLRSHKPDLILSCGYERPETFASLVYSKLSKAKVFVFIENQVSDKPRNRLVEIAKSLYLRFFDGFCAGGFTHLNYLVNLSVPKEKVVLGYDCVDNSGISKLSAYYRALGKRIASPDNYFLCVSRLIAKKNIPTLLSAYHIYKQFASRTGQPWQLLICGDGELKDDTLSKISTLNLSEDITLPGQIDDFKQVVNYLAFAKALILPSNKSEQWGLVVNEAMAAKTPVLVAKQCGCSQHLVEEGVNGFTFDGNFANELANHMIWLHQNQHLLAAMGEKSWEIVQQYSPAKFAKNIKSLYESL